MLLIFIKRCDSSFLLKVEPVTALCTRNSALALSVSWWPGTPLALSVPGTLGSRNSVCVECVLLPEKGGFIRDSAAALSGPAPKPAVVMGPPEVVSGLMIRTASAVG